MLEALETLQQWMMKFTTILILGTTVIVILYIFFVVYRVIQLQMFPDIEVVAINPSYHLYFWKGVGIAYLVAAFAFFLPIAVHIGLFIGAFYLLFRIPKVMRKISGIS